jgi:hypothetical protein
MVKTFLTLALAGVATLGHANTYGNCNFNMYCTGDWNFGNCQINYDCGHCPNSVPDNAWTVALLGAALLTLEFARRKLLLVGAR